MKFTRLAVSLLALGLPFTSFAATLTPQQLLDRSYSSWNVQSPTASTFQFEMKSWTKYSRTPAYPAPEFEVKFNMVADSFPRGGTMADGTVQFQLPYLKFKSGNETYELRNPVTVDVRSVGMDVYFRVSSVSEQVRGYLSALDPSVSDKLNQIVGQWVHVNLQDVAAQEGSTGLGQLPLSDLQDRSKYMTLARDLENAKVVKVTGVEKRYVGADGHKMIRVRAALNPKIVDVIFKWMQQQNLMGATGSNVGSGGVALGAPNMATMKAEVKKVLAEIKLAAVLDQTDGSLDRIEMAVHHVEPSYTYKWVRNKEVKVRQGTSYLNLAIGAELRPIADRSVEVPANSISLEAFQQMLQPPTPVEPTPTPMPEPLPSEDTSYLPSGVTSPQTITERDHVRGNPTGPVTMVVYSDFECPFCQRYQTALNQALREFPQDLRMVYRNYPLSFHPYAQPAAEAAECAGRVGGSRAFWTMHDALFTQGSTDAGFSDATWLTLARQQGLNETAFQACMNDHDTVGKINEDVYAGTQSGVEGTPTIYLNGNMLSGAVPYETLKAALQAAGAHS